MPLGKLKEKAGKYWPLLEYGFWIAVFIFAYVAMMKVMHPGFTVFGV